MARKCDVCGKGPQSGNNVAHSNKKTKRTFDVNLQKVKARVDGSVKSIFACTSCIRSNKVEKA